MAVIQYATVRPYWPDVFWHYWHVLIDYVGMGALAGMGLLLVWRLVQWYGRFRR